MVSELAPSWLEEEEEEGGRRRRSRRRKMKKKKDVFQTGLYLTQHKKIKINK
jgi:hypothetical protein